MTFPPASDETVICAETADKVGDLRGDEGGCILHVSKMMKMHPTC